LAKIRENSPVATGLKSPEIAKNGDFRQKRPKKAILRGSAPKRGFSALLGPFPQGFYINPSGALPGGRGTPGDLPEGVPETGSGSRIPDPGSQPPAGGSPVPGGGVPRDPGTPGSRIRAPDPAARG